MPQVQEDKYEKLEPMLGSGGKISAAFCRKSGQRRSLWGSALFREQAGPAVTPVAPKQENLSDFLGNHI